MSAANGGLAPHVLHVLPDAETLRLIGAFGTKLRHTLVTRDGLLPQGLRPSPSLRPASNFPGLEGLPLPGRMQKIARAMTPYDLVLTHGVGALDVAMAHTLFKDAMNLPPLIHHERNAKERCGLKAKWYRRLALGKSAGLVVPGEELEEAALVDWQQPLGRVKRIPPATDTKAFARKPKKDGFRLIKRPGEMWIGVWPSRFDASALGALARGFDRLATTWHLVIMGERDVPAVLQDELDRLQIGDRVHFPGTTDDPTRVIGLFDIFVDLGDSRAFPVHAIEAMAASLPVVAPKDSELSQLLSTENAAWLFDPKDEDLLGAHLHGLSENKAERALLGEANRAKAVKEYDTDKVTATYRQLYSSAMKQEF